MTVRRRSVLVVDDEIDTCQNLADILGDLDYDVDTALSGPAALQLVRQKPYDVALLDLKMPGMDGLTLYREMRKLRPDTVAMIVTAYATTGVTDEAIHSGAWRVLSKPVDLSALLPLVDDASRQPLVMVVDDDEALCDNLWELLRQRSLRVGLAHNERDAISRIETQNFQVVLVDLKLPDGDGRNVLHVLRDRHPDVRTVLITAHGGDFDTGPPSNAAPADAVCFKPFDTRLLIETVDRLAHRQG